MKKGRLPFFYGWVIVVLSCFLIFAVIGVGHNVWTIFTVPICEDLGLTRQQFSMFYTVTSVSEIISLLTVSKIFDKIGQLRTMRIAALVMPAAVFGISRANSAAGLYVCAAIMGYGIMASSFYALSIIISNWFDDNRGTATGVVFMSSPLGSMILIPIVSRWIEKNGWRSSVVYLAAMMAFFTVLITWFGLKERPQDVGLEPFRTKDHKAQNAVQDPDEGWGFSRLDLLTHAGSLLIVLAHLASYMAGSCCNTVVPYLQDTGFSDSAAAAVQSVGLGLIAFGRLAGGKLSDKFGPIKVMKGAYMLAPLMLVGLILTPRSSAFLAIMMIGYTASQVSSAVCLPLVVRKLFGRKNYSSVYGLFSAIGSTMGAVMPLVLGSSCTKHGSYLPIYRIILCGTVAAFLVLCLGVKLQEKYLSENVKK